MKARILVTAGAFMVLASSLVAAKTAENASIHFANYGGIREWTADGNQRLYVRGRDRRWYHATLREPCPGLPTTARIKFVPDRAGNFDRYSSIIVNNQQYGLASLSLSDPPIRKATGKP